MQTKNVTLIIIFSLLSLSAHARLELPRVISSNMVLQRDSVSPIWGQDDPGNEVTVSIAGQVKKTKALENGKWAINLDPLKVGGPYEMKIASPDDEVILSNILVGEVWVCSGQSNMEWSVKASNNPAEEISNAKFPNIRLFHVPKKASSFPESDCNASWKECSPENIPNFSAVAYYFGRHLHNELKVPIGLIGSAWGGTRIEPWTPVSGFDSVPSLRGVADKVRRYTNLDQVVDRAQRWAEAVKRAVDGSEECERKLQRMLHWDVNNGVARRAWARNTEAEFAIRRAMDAEPLLRVTLPQHVDEKTLEFMRDSGE